MRLISITDDVSRSLLQQLLKRNVLPAVDAPIDGLAVESTMRTLGKGALQAAPGNGPQLNAWFNVQTYGAVGDGTTDDATAIQAAINAAIANGGGVVYFPRAIYALASMLTAVRAGHIDLRFIGESATLKVIAGSQIEAMLKIARNSPQDAYRFHTTVRGLNFKGSSKAYAGIAVPAVGGSDVLDFSQVYVESCHIGIDLQSTMESHFADISLFSNDIGLRLRPVLTGGGGNANDFHGVKITNGQIGIALYAPADEYPFGNNVFTGTLIQGVTCAAIFAAGSLISNNVFVGAHIETPINAPGTVVVDMGDFGAAHNLTLPKADLLLYSGSLTFYGAANFNSIISDAHANLEGGRSALLGSAFFRDSDIGPNLGFRTRFVSFTGSGVSLDNATIELSQGVIDLRSFHRSTTLTEAPPHRTKDVKAGQTDSAYNVDAPATGVVEYDPVLGKVVVVTFDASAASWATNAYRQGPKTQPIPANTWLYLSALVKADRDTSIWVQVSGDAGISYQIVALKANRWSLIRQATTSWGAPILAGLSLHPAGTDAPVLRVAQPFFQFASDIYETARLFNINACEPDVVASATVNPGAIAAGAGYTSAGITATGAVLGDRVSVIAPYDLQGIVATAYVSAANTVKIQLANLTGGGVTLASGTWVVRVIKD